MNAWEIYSPCTPRCVTSARPSVTRMDAVRRWLAVTSALAGAVPAVRRSELGPPARRALAELGVEVAANTDRLSVPGTRGTLIVANHLSWLDIVAILALEPVGFLAKREVRRWPVLGGIAARYGMRFIDRHELRGLPAVVDDLTAALRSGESIVVFPEGTTWCGRCGLPGGEFRRAAFQAAIDAGAPVRPVTFEYRQGEDQSTVASFVGDDGLLTSLGRVARASDLRLRITAHPALAPVGDRRELAARARAGVFQASHV